MKTFYQHYIATGFHNNIEKKNIFKMFSVKCFDNILAQTVFVPIFSEYLLNVYLQTLAKKMEISDNRGYKRTQSKLTPHPMLKSKH